MTLKQEPKESKPRHAGRHLRELGSLRSLLPHSCYFLLWDQSKFLKVSRICQWEMAIQKVLQGMVSGSLVRDLTPGTGQETEAQITKAKPTPRRPTPSNSVAYKNLSLSTMVPAQDTWALLRARRKHMTASCGQPPKRRGILTWHSVQKDTLIIINNVLAHLIL